MAEQKNRQLSINSPLGKDVLLLTKFTGEESLSSPFKFTLQLLSEKRDIKPEELVEKKVTFSIKLADATPRFFNGYVSRLRGGRGDTRFRSYQAEVVPWLRLLEHTNDCRIFQNKTALEVIEAVFGDHKFADFKTDHVSKRGPAGILDRKIEYCVQYRESDLNFVSRLMEEHGIHYYFKHEDGKHTLILTDSKNNYPWCTEKEVEYVAGTAGSAAADGISDWTHNYEIRPSAWAYSDYDFKNPKTKQLSTISTLPSSNLPGRSGDLELEVFDYPGDYVKPAEGKQLAELRMGEEESAYNTVTGASACRSFMTGGKFKFKDPDQPDEDGKTYVLSKIVHEAEEPAEYESGGGAVPTAYKNTFECIPDAINFRALRVTPKPFVKGVQTAVVSGPAGADVYPDEFGRVKVQFFWDRYGKNDDNSSCWLRVSQTWAGKSWGSMHIPWIGQEVIVDFLEGNPDRPIITGRVYNGDQKPVLTLPQHKHMNVVARDTYGNEIIFDHTEGDEHIRIHSPHHNSSLELGRSVTLVTSSDNFQTTIGNLKTFTYGDICNMEFGTESKVVVGGYDQAVIGGLSDAVLGLKFGLNVGFISTVQIAGVFEYNLGYSVAYRKGKQIELNDEGFVKSTKKNIILDSDAVIGILGGENDAAMARLDRKCAQLSYMDASENQQYAGEHATAKLGKGIAMTLLSSLVAQATGVSLAFGLAKNAANQHGDKVVTPIDVAQVKEAQSYNTDALVGAGLTTAGLTTIGMAKLYGIANKLGSASTKPFKHDAPDAELLLTKEAGQLKGGDGKQFGYVACYANGRVQLKSDQGKNSFLLDEAGDIQGKTDSNFKIRCDNFWVQSGKMTHKNFVVLE